MITKDSWATHEQENIGYLTKKSDLRKNPTFLTCLILFRDIFDDVK